MAQFGYADQTLNHNSYVLAVAASSLFINTYHFVLTARARRASGIKLPNAYATHEQAEKDPKAHAFNCAQRAHSNFTENYTPFLGALLISGLRFPVPSAVLGAAFVFGRVWYAAGYTSQGPKGRSKGFVTSVLSDALLKGLALWAGVQMALEAN